MGHIRLYVTHNHDCTLFYLFLHFLIFNASCTLLYHNYKVTFLTIFTDSSLKDILLVNGTMLNDTFVPIDCTDCDSLECCVDRVQVVMYNNTADEPSYPLWRSFTIQIEVCRLTKIYVIIRYCFRLLGFL